MKVNQLPPPTDVWQNTVRLRNRDFPGGYNIITGDYVNAMDMSKGYFSVKLPYKSTAMVMLLCEFTLLYNYNKAYFAKIFVRIMKNPSWTDLPEQYQSCTVITNGTTPKVYAKGINELIIKADGTEFITSYASLTLDRMVAADAIINENLSNIVIEYKSEDMPSDIKLLSTKVLKAT